MVGSRTRWMRNVFLGVCLGAVAPLLLGAQATETLGDPAAKAESLFAARDWPGAVAAYREVVAAHPDDALAWFNLGASYHALNDWQAALDAYAKAGEAGYAPVAIATRRSRVLAREGQKDAALVELGEAVKLGLTRLDVLENDPDFEPVRSEARFVALVAEVRKKVDPCSASPEYQRLGFWVGTWEVQVPAGNPVATSRITSILNSCAIHEDFTQNDGRYAGQSLSAWSAGAKQWTQLYVDSLGEVQTWVGQIDGTTVVFTREGTATDGTPARFRMTYTPDGANRVRQFIERSSDQGKSWNSEFDGLYVRQ